MQMINWFGKKTPPTLAELTERHKELSARAEQARAARDRADNALLTAKSLDDATVAKCTAEYRTAQDQADMAETAVKQLDAQIEAAKAKQAAEKAQAERAAAAAETNRKGDTLAVTVDALDQAAKNTLDAIAALAVPGSEHFVGNIRLMLSELPGAIRTQLVDAARAHASAILAGTAVVPIAAPPEPEPALPAAPTRSVFLLHPSRWRDVQGVEQCAGRHRVVQLPVDLAARALARNLADDPASERARNLLAAYGVDYATPLANICIDLASDDEPPKAKPRYTERDGRDVIDRVVPLPMHSTMVGGPRVGPARTLTTAGPTR